MTTHIWASEEEVRSEFQGRTPLLTAEKIIGEVNVGLGENATTLLEALEALYGHGFQAELSGNVEAPCGHFYRVAHWIVTTDSQGFHSVEAYGSLGEAMREFQKREDDYAEWDETGEYLD